MSRRCAIGRHALMVNDPHRTPALLRAVAAAVRPGDVVLDIGTGLGVLAIAAAELGASEVIACDVDRAALAEARRRAVEAKVADKITFIKSISFDLKLPKGADVVLCETVGSFAFDENILATLSDAKKRLLKRGGKIVPERLELWGAPIARHGRIRPPADIAPVGHDDLMAEPVLMASCDFEKKISTAIRLRPFFKATKSGKIAAFACWPKAIWRHGHVSDASPLLPPTHWLQGILPVEPRSVDSGERCGIEIIIRPNPLDPMQMTERLWRWIEKRDQ